MAATEYGAVMTRMVLSGNGPKYDLKGCKLKRS